MNLFWSIRQWLFERTLFVFGVLALGVTYQVGTIWYANLRVIGSAYGIAI